MVWWECVMSESGTEAWYSCGSVDLYLFLSWVPSWPEQWQFYLYVLPCNEYFLRFLWLSLCLYTFLNFTYLFLFLVLFGTHLFNFSSSVIGIWFILLILYLQLCYSAGWLGAKIKVWSPCLHCHGTLGGGRGLGLSFLTSALDGGESLASPWPLYLREKPAVPSRKAFMCWTT